MNTTELINHLYHIEKRIIAYQQLHTEELAELWKALNECKEAIAALNQRQVKNENDLVLERRQQ
jgi:diadenosine tetraphosphate (Ap4A) HIT family hydrolase